MRCPLCVGKWNAEHGRRRRTGRIVIRAIRAFLDAGGKNKDIDKLKLSAELAGSSLADDFKLAVDPLGYMDDIARLDGADVDLTSELLADILQLTHPDHHPPKRRDLARRVTQGLLALKPFVFPEPKPEPVEPAPAEPKASEPTEHNPTSQESEARYPCSDCADAVPMDYCDACRAEWEKREQEKSERQRAKQRAEYARRRQRILAQRALATCAVCGTKFKAKRDDARFCSDRCRQRSHRNPVTAKNSVHGTLLISRDELQRAILALLDRHRAVFQNDLLPKKRTPAQYQAVSLAASKLEADGKIETLHYCWRFNKPGFKVLVKPGHTVEHADRIHRLKDGERLTCVRLRGGP